MGGAILVTAPGLYFLTNQNIILADKMYLPTNKDIDKKLIFGSLMFGVGWGLAGLCPGPAISSLGLLESYTFVFAFFMFLGFLSQNLLRYNFLK